MASGSASLPSRRDALRLLAAGGLCAAGGALAAACTGPSRPRPAPSPSLRSGGMSVLDHGAKGDGHTDDSDAILRAFAALKPGGTLSFPGDRVFCHSKVLAVTTPRVWIQGPGTLRATAEQASALQIQASGVTVSSLRLEMGTTTQRWSAAEQHKLFLGSHDGITLRDVAVVGSAAAGVFAFGATNFRIDRVSVRDTRADGIHMTYGSRHGVVTDPKVTRSGDDGVAVVSYLGDGTPCGDIRVHSPAVHTTTGGRGISVVGGHDVHYDDVDLSSSNAAGIYIACEGGDFVTYSTERVSVTGGSVTGANTNDAIDHGAILVYSGRSGGAVEDVTVSDITVRGTRAGASRQIGAVADAPEDLVKNVVFQGLDLASTPTPYEGNAPVSGVDLNDVQAAGSAVRASVTR